MTVPCLYCQRPVDPQSRFVWRRVSGWERKGVGESRRGGSDITCREAEDDYACDACVSRLRSGLSTAQGAML